MNSRVKVAGHAIHPMLIPFPLGLLATAVVFDVLYLITDRTGFTVAAAFAIGAGIIGGAIAAPFGWIDWFAIPSDTRAKRIGLVHGLGNGVVLVLFAISWLVRANANGWIPNGWALTCSFAAVALAVATAWMGGELVERLSVGVDDGANVDAPSSLTHKHVAA
jgi:uncharacterized membrane protein